MMECGGNNMDIDDVVVAAHSLPMVDNDNEPAPENEPVADGALVDFWCQLQEIIGTRQCCP